MNSSISSHYSDFQPSFKYKFFELANAIHTSSKIPVTIWSFNITEYIQNNQNYTADKIQNFVQKLWTCLNAMKRINNPNILRIYETSDEEAEHNLVSFSSERIKYCLDGTCFKKPNESRIPFSKDESLFIASQLSDGLAYLHDQLNAANFGICPENVFITPNFEVKIGTLIHFAKFSEPLSEIEPSLYPTETSIFDIDKRFLSPELKAHKNVTSKSDVFMFGLTILYCYEGENFLNEMSSSESSEPQFLADFLNGPNSSNTPEDMKLILSKCLSEEPSERPTFQQISDSNTLSQLLIKVLNFIETIEEKPVENHKSFYKGLSGIIDQYSERILLSKIIPILVNDAYRNYRDDSLLTEYILPMFITASTKLHVSKIDTKVVRKVFANPTCHNYFMEKCRNYLTSESEDNEIKDQYPFIGVVILNAFRSEGTKEKGKYLMKLLFEKSESLDQDELKESVFVPLFSYPDCAILFLFYIQTTEDDEDKDFQNLAVLSILHAMEIAHDENSSRLNQKILELMPKLFKYSKSLKIKTFKTLVLDPVISKPESLNALLNNLDQFDDPDYLVEIAISLKEKKLPSSKVFPILMPICETMKLENFDEKVFKPFFFTDSRCALSMIENIDKIKKIESNSPPSTNGTQLTVVQSIIINSFKNKEEIIRNKVPEAIPFLFDSITTRQRQNPDFLKDSIFSPFYENYSSESPEYQEKSILQLVKNSPIESPIADIIVDLTFEHCKSNEEILNETSKLIPSYILNSSQIKPEVVQYLIDNNKYTSSISDAVVSKISTINDPNIKLFVLKFALENATESTDFATLAWTFITAANSTEFCQKYNSSKFSEISTTFVGPLFKRIESADYLIQNFDAFDHQYPTSKKIQMLLVAEISALANENPDLSALNDMVPQLIQKCSIDTSESISSIKSISQSISLNEKIDSAYISTILDSLNQQISEELAPECSKQLRALYSKIKKVKNDEANKKLIINKIATVISNLPSYTHKTTSGITLAIELVESKYIETSKREKLLNFIDQTVTAIRNVKDYQPSESESDNDDESESEENKDKDESQKEKQNQSQPRLEKSSNPFGSQNGTQNSQDPFSSNDSLPNKSELNDSKQSIKDPFNAASSSNDPFKIPSNNQDSFSTTSNSSFNNAPSSSNDFFNQRALNDPFKTPSNANNDPFKATSNANNDPFKATSNVNNDPFKTTSNTNNDPFKTTSNANNDPFKTTSNANNDPFKATSNVNNDPFKTTSNTNNNPFKTTSNANNDHFKVTSNANNDPFKTTSNANNDPFKATSNANNDPFKATSNVNNDPFKTSSQTPIASQEDQFSSQSSSTANQVISNNNALPQFPSIQQSAPQSSKSAKDSKKDKKKEKEKEKKKKEKMDKKLKAKEKKAKDKERRKSRNDIPTDTSQPKTPTFIESTIANNSNNANKPDPNIALKSRAMSKPELNPFNVPSNAVDPFKKIEATNHFETANQNNDPFKQNEAANQFNDPFKKIEATNHFETANQSNDPFGKPNTSNNPFASSASTNNSNPSNMNNPFVSPQSNNNPPSNLSNPFVSAQKPANNNISNDPFAKPNSNPFVTPQKDDEDQEDDGDDSKHHHHRHDHHRGKSKANDDDDVTVPEKRQTPKTNTNSRQTIQPSFSGFQGDSAFSQSQKLQRTPSFDIFGKSQLKTSTFENESKATSDAKIDFNNDEIDFDD